MRILIKAAVFQHTAARRRLDASALLAKLNILFQHTAARRRLERYSQSFDQFSCVSTHSRPKAAGQAENQAKPMTEVSTHSRPKAAGEHHARDSRRRRSFNTQPPEGGWKSWHKQTLYQIIVSTHSRPKAAGSRPCRFGIA